MSDLSLRVYPLMVLLLLNVQNAFAQADGTALVEVHAGGSVNVIGTCTNYGELPLIVVMRASYDANADKHLTVEPNSYDIGTLLPGQSEQRTFKVHALPRPSGAPPALFSEDYRFDIKCDALSPGPNSYTSYWTFTVRILPQEQQKEFPWQQPPWYPGWCIIATASYGSVLAPEVQLLRDFRDDQVEATAAGRGFLGVFSPWYYSFSPGVASFIAAHDVVREAMKAMLYPLIGTLSLSSITSQGLRPLNSELGTVIAGALAGSLVGVIYLSPMLLAVIFIGRFNRIVRPFRPMLKVLGGATGLLVLAEFLPIPALLAIAGTAFIITVLCLAGWYAAATVVLYIKRDRGTSIR